MGVRRLCSRIANKVHSPPVRPEGATAPKGPASLYRAVDVRDQAAPTISSTPVAPEGAGYRCNRGAMIR
jgi:hypothetical protein